MFETAPFLVLWSMAAAAAPPDVTHDPANKAAAVIVVSATAAGGGHGSGAVVDARGLVLTNLHVVDLAAAKLTKDGEGLFVCADPVRSMWLMEPRSEAMAKRLPGSMACRRAKLVGTSLTDDLALLRTDQLMSAVRVTDEIPNEGEAIHSRAAVADFLAPSLKCGRFIARIDPNYFRVGDPRRMMPPQFILDLGAMPGASGGPVFDANGRMFALIVAVMPFPGRSDTFAIPGAAIIPFIRAHDPFQPRP